MPSQTSKKKTTQAAGWKGKKAIVTQLELPSENICKVRRTSIAKLMAANIFPDELQSMISSNISKAKGQNPAKKSGESAEVDMKNFPVFLEAIDKVAVMVIVEPKVVRPVRIDEDGNEVELEDDERDIDVLYTDDVDLEDKIFVFQWAVGGDSNLTTFRRELSAGVGSVVDGAGVEDTPV